MPFCYPANSIKALKGLWYWQNKNSCSVILKEAML